jgi:hypothetical protein
MELNNNLVSFSQGPMINPDQEVSNSWVIDMEIDFPTHSVSEAISSPTTAKKRRGRHHTPIVDDEVRRSARLRNEVHRDHIQLDGEPRRKGATKKSVSFSSVTDLKKVIVGSSLDEGPIEFEVAPIQAPTLVDLGISFCGVPPSELNLATLLHEGEDQ